MKKIFFVNGDFFLKMLMNILFIIVSWSPSIPKMKFFHKISKNIKRKVVLYESLISNKNKLVYKIGEVFWVN